MEVRPLGKTGLKVSGLALGTVEIGMDYGFKGTQHYARPTRSDCIRLVHRALDLGINVIDTARKYGDAESVLGEALKLTAHKPIICSKVFLSDTAVTSDSDQLFQEISQSVDESLRALQRDSIDMLLVHNTKVEHMRRAETCDALERICRTGKIRFAGASCYGEETPLSALRHPTISALQVPYNFLDRRMERHVFSTASRNGTGIFIRSAFLRGILTDQYDTVPQQLWPIRDRGRKAFELAKDDVQSLSELALRFCLSIPDINSVVIGVKSIDELEANVADANRGRLADDVLQRLAPLAMNDDPLVDPQDWSGLI